MRKDWRHGAGGSADSWDVPDPPPFVDEWMARQVIRFHERGDVPCAGCARGLICERLAMARAVIAAAQRDDVGGAAPGGSAQLFG